MNKSLKSLFALVLLLALLGSLSAPVFAQEGEVMKLSTPEELVELAQRCTLDSYSQNLTVSLQNDLDVSQVEFHGIPTFCGTFLGNHHRITGLSMEQEGSVQGFFRYLAPGAVVENLSISGQVMPQGSRCRVGGLVGSNSGILRSCSFEGEVSGADRIGGIAAVNQVGGVIESCTVYGTVHGSHMVGGVCGENLGLIRSCQNNASVNTTVSDNAIMVSDITTDTIMGAESPDTVTDLGGIAGVTTGVVRSCVNHGAVGYAHMGYNIGGIAGRQSGLIQDCSNLAAVSGRKEVAGICGQMLPVVEVEFTEDTLQILRGQLDTTSALADRASSNLRHSSQSLKNQMSDLSQQAEIAAEAITDLLPSKEHPQLPDPDSLQAAQNTLSSSLSSMGATMESVNSTAHNGISTVAGDISAISRQLNAISQTLDEAREHLGGSITDVSDLDTEDSLSGKVSGCSNSGRISGDLNVGGICGSISWENTMDPEEDFGVLGEESLHFDSELRAVILGCVNRGAVSVTKRNAGGICGNAALGLIRSCTNTGNVGGEKAQQIGGIAGTCQGFLRSCHVKCTLEGKQYIGGVAGSATEVSDCRSLARLPAEGERLGAVLGDCDRISAELIHGNYFLPSSRLGAIDGISYFGCAEPKNLEEFQAIPELSPIFTHAKLQFIFEDGNQKTVTVELGQRPEQIPQVPPKEGCIGRWSQLDEADLDHVYFDLVLTPEYTPSRTVLQSDLSRPDGRAVLLAEGNFSQSEGFPLTASQQTPSPAQGETLEECWALPQFPGEVCTGLRLALPQALEGSQIRLLVCDADGSWQEAPFTENGSYLVLSIDQPIQALALLSQPRQNFLPFAVGGGILLVGAGIFLLLRRKKKQKT